MLKDAFTSKVESKTSAFWIREWDTIQVWKKIFSQNFSLEAVDKNKWGEDEAPADPGG